MSDDRLTVPDAAAWRAWLDANEATSDGVRLVLAKKGTSSPTSLTYAEALDEALCSGWIDGRRNAIDEATFQQHFTPRRARSIWSVRNVDHVARLVEPPENGHVRTVDGNSGEMGLVQLRERSSRSVRAFARDS